MTTRRPPSPPTASASVGSNKSTQSRYTVDVNAARETIDSYSLRPGDGARGEGARLRIPAGAKLELFDNQVHHAPKDVWVRKVGKDLHLAFPGSKIETPDIIVQGFYEGDANNRLIGKGVDGAYHPYAAVSGKSTEGVSVLGDNAVAAQTLTKTTVAPWGTDSNASNHPEAVSTAAATAPLNLGAATPSSSAHSMGVDTHSASDTHAASGSKPGMSASTAGWIAGGGLLLLGAAAGGGGKGGGAATSSASQTPPVPLEAVVTTLEGGGPIKEGANTTYTVKLNISPTKDTTYALNVSGTGVTWDDVGPPTFSDGVKYDSVTHSVTVPAGAPPTFTMMLPIANDGIIEPTETMAVTLGGVNAATGSVISDGIGPQAVQTLTAGAAQVAEKEGAVIEYTVKLNGPSANAQTYDFQIGGAVATHSATQIGPTAFTNGVTIDANGKLNVPAGVSDFKVTIPVANDITPEPNEAVNITVGGKHSSDVTIFDDDKLLIVNLAPAQTAPVEGAPLIFNVTLNTSAAMAVPLPFAFTGGTATAGSDYSEAIVCSNGVQLVNGQLVVPANVSSFTISIPTINDLQLEAPIETVKISVGGVEATGFIQDFAQPLPATAAAHELIDLHAFLQQAQQSLSAQPSQSPDPLNPANQAPHATRYAIETILHQENHENQPTDAPPEPSIAHTAPTAHALAQISINLDAGNLHDWHSQHALGQAVVLGA